MLQHNSLIYPTIIFIMIREKKVSINLEGVSRTLLLPLLGRAKFSQEPYSPIHDERAVKLVNSLDYDFDHLQKQAGKLTLFWMARAYHFDNKIKEYLKNHPRAVIVNLGAGLETNFYRIDNGQLTWVDLDLPEVIELREKLLPPPPRVHYIAQSILDYSWIEDIKRYGADIFLLGAGFFMYFNETQVKSILIEMANHFSQAELVFDIISSKALNHANKFLKNADMNVSSKWGLNDGKSLEEWSPKIKFISQQSYFKDIKRYTFPLMWQIRIILGNLFYKHTIIHLKFL
jgi:O-methyltransferase involved in polyketide biosynthesis